MRKIFIILLFLLLAFTIYMSKSIYSATERCNKDTSFYMHECLIQLCSDQEYFLLLKMTSESYARHGERDFREHYITLFGEVIYPYSESSPGDYGYNV